MPAMSDAIVSLRNTVQVQALLTETRNPEDPWYRRNLIHLESD